MSRRFSAGARTPSCSARVRSRILEAEGEGRAVRLVNQAVDRYFVGNAQLLRRLTAVETALSSNAKIAIPSNTELVNVIGEMAGILRLAARQRHRSRKRGGPSRDAESGRIRPNGSFPRWHVACLVSWAP